MKLNKTFLSVALLSSSLLAGCDYNDKYFDGLDDMTTITDVKNLDYTLTADDYTSITSLGENYATANDQSDALVALKTTMAFTTELKAENYVPFYLADKFPTADKGSVVRVTYNAMDDTNPVVLAINQSSEYKLTADDYATVWTDGSGYTFFTPSKPAKDAIPGILATAKPDAVEGDYVMVSYSVADEDPAVETGGDTGMTYDSVLTRATVATDTAHAIYMYNGSEWVAVDAVCPSKADFEEMGNSYGNFSSSMLPQDYLPAYLRMHLPYAQEGDSQVCAYLYYGGDNAILSTEYVYTNGAWVLENYTTEETKQFQLIEGGWVYNPSVTVTLPYVKNDPLSVSYFQPIVDWVWENVDVPAGVAAKGEGFVSKYGNNDYYTGASAYHGNVDWRAAKAKEQNLSAYESMSDEEAVEFMQENFKTALASVLPSINPNLKYIDGVEVSITINFTVYTGAPEDWTIKYIIQSDGSYKYVEDSMHAVE